MFELLDFTDTSDDEVVEIIIGAAEGADVRLEANECSAVVVALVDAVDGEV